MRSWIRKAMFTLIFLGAAWFFAAMLLALLLTVRGYLDKIKIKELVRIVRDRHFSEEILARQREVKISWLEKSELERAKIMDEAEQNWSKVRAEREQELSRFEGNLHLLKAELLKEKEAIEVRSKELQAREQEFLARERRWTAALSQEGFLKNTEVYQSMKPKEVMTILLKIDDREAARYLRAFDSRFAAKVLAEYLKRGEEGEIRAKKLQTLMERPVP